MDGSTPLNDVQGMIAPNDVNMRLILAFKDAIVTTCDQNGLQYVQDQTNFDPSLTPRNAVRAILNGADVVGPITVPGQVKRANFWLV